MRTMSWKKHSKRPLDSGDFPLQITSLADVFTILLVFLLKSFASSAAFFQPTAGLVIPSASQDGSPLQESLRLEVQPRGILLEGRFITGDLQTSEGKKALSQAFELARSRQNFLKERNPEFKADHRLLVIADRALPYAAVQPALQIAAATGYGDLHWVISTENTQ